jgi:hypothetical protein
MRAGGWCGDELWADGDADVEDELGADDGMDVEDRAGLDHRCGEGDVDYRCRRTRC